MDFVFLFLLDAKHDKDGVARLVSKLGKDFGTVNVVENSVCISLPLSSLRTRESCNEILSGIGRVCRMLTPVFGVGDIEENLVGSGVYERVLQNRISPRIMMDESKFCLKNTGRGCVFWLHYFSKGFVNVKQFEALKEVPAWKKEGVGEGLLIALNPRYGDWGDEDNGRAASDYILKVFGVIEECPVCDVKMGWVEGDGRELKCPKCGFVAEETRKLKLQRYRGI